MRILLLILFFASQIACAQDNVKTVYDADHEFDAGSGIQINQLSEIQIQNLATLGKVWGFLKYHHPAVTTGQRQWDYDLFRITPGILAAPDRASANTILHNWISGLGEVASCNTCSSLPSQNLYAGPALGWIDDGKLLSAALRADLRKIHLNRSASGAQFYLSQVKQVGNPQFQNEPAYKDVKFPDAGFQLLSLFRFWNIIEYWAPYRDLIDENWDDVLRHSLAKVALATDRASYEREMMTVVARIHDTHTNLSTSQRVRPPLGACNLPVNIRFVGSNAVIANYSEEGVGKATGLKPGDIIESLDNVPVAKLIQDWTPYYAASNVPTRLRDIARNLSSGPCIETKLRIRRGNDAFDLAAMRLPQMDQRPSSHDRPGETFQLLSDDVAYIKLSSIKRADIPAYMEAAAKTKGLVIDIRNYPSDFVVFELGQYLVDRPTNFARFTAGDLDNPGAFHWKGQAALRPGKMHYAGKVMILIDEVSQSQAEYTAMAFRSAPRAKVIGSTTAGADGNVSSFSLPGGLKSAISGIGVFYPDKRPTQRIGIIPDIEVRPTVHGIRDGRDELLEAAIAEIRRSTSAQ